jgi:hypothetical protein
MDVSSQCEAIYSPALSDGTYHADIDFGKRHLGGLLIVKTFQDTLRHAVFMSETGFKYFDFAFSSVTFHKAFILPVMDRRGIIHTLCNDLSAVLISPATTLARKDRSDSTHIILDFPLWEHGRRYTADKLCHALSHISLGNMARPKVDLSIENIEGKPIIIHIQHHHIPLQIIIRGENSTH